MVTEASGGSPLGDAQAAGHKKSAGMVAAHRICSAVDAWHEPRRGPAGIPANSGIRYENVNTVKAVKVTVNGTESHVLLHHDLRGTGTLTSRLHSSEKGNTGWLCGFHYTTINSSQLVSGILPNLHRD